MTSAPIEMHSPAPEVLPAANACAAAPGMRFAEGLRRTAEVWRRPRRRAALGIRRRGGMPGRGRAPGVGGILPVSRSWRGARHLKISDAAPMSHQLAPMRIIPRSTDRRILRSIDTSRLKSRRAVNQVSPRDPVRCAEAALAPGKLRVMTRQKGISRHRNVPVRPVNDR